MNLKDYIQGKRHGKDANQLERAAMNDPFLEDAIEGFDSVPGNHLPVIEELEKNILKRSSGKTNQNRLWIFGIAASIIFLLGIGTLLKMYNSHENILTPQSAQLENRIEQKVVESEIEIIDETKIKENQKNIALNVQKTKPESASDNDIEVSEEIIVNDNITASSVAEIEIDALELNEVSDKHTGSTTQIKAESSYSVQKTTDDKLSGIVLDEAGEPMVGVSVILKNKHSGTITDLNGRFELVAPRNEQLVASYIGYEKKEITVTDDSAIIRLKPDNLALNEVVVIGYGSKKRKTTVGSITKTDEVLSGRIPGVEVNVGSITKTDEVLSGRIPGVEVKQMSKGDTFGENEFKKYFEKNRNQTICENKPNSITAVFYVDLTGKPINIKINESSCKELENEFLRLINTSPVWTKVNRNVSMTIRLR